LFILGTIGEVREVFERRKKKGGSLSLEVISEIQSPVRTPQKMNKNSSEKAFKNSMAWVLRVTPKS